MGIGVAVGNAVRAVGVDVGIAAVVALMLCETVASMLGVGTGAWACVAAGVGVVADVVVAVAAGSKGIAVGRDDLVHATRDTSITRAKFIKRFLFKVIQRPPCLSAEPVHRARPLRGTVFRTLQSCWAGRHCR